ncbi:NAD+ kinase [Clostridium cavendishii DSM 21758]|uniref:NAD kinase n=1 Tax=Clostridium cavendishii DSM 21758 TaxID=1121302 RepID=A0A1M6KJ98_9CLOT|nr:NAD(+)/NADH kinase [Clostridium cavendishii]SHJ59036.1 NAD+ kinase [Clostridium cavendishii DSM 21758]
MDNIGIIINNIKDANGVILNKVKSKIKNTFPNSDILILHQFDHQDKKHIKNLSLLVVLGGDGTLLGVARDVLKYIKAPILGVNIGNLGFLSSVECDEIDIALSELKKGNYKIEPRMMLNCTIEGEEWFSSNALNDIVVAKGTLSRMVKYRIYVDNNYYASFKGDGVIVSTPTGSTAYSFSAGGPLIYPSLELISIVPICSHTPNVRPIILNANSSIDILAENLGETMYLTIDGQKSISLKKKTNVKITKSVVKCEIVVFNNKNYFSVLRKKILDTKKECEGD